MLKGGQYPDLLAHQVKEHAVSTYLFDQAWQQEHDRLHALEALFDDASAHHLARLGAGPG